MKRDAVTWHGRRGPVLLGPTEHRVARYLADLTRVGRVTIRTVDLVSDLRIERSEVYRITARLRVLGLFGIENDRGGTKGGRRYWRTAIAHDHSELDAERHRAAWARIVAWARAKRERSAARLSALRHHTRPEPVTTARALTGQPFGQRRVPVEPAGDPPGSGGLTFAQRMRAAGLGELMDGWGVA